VNVGWVNPSALHTSDPDSGRTLGERNSLPIGGSRRVLRGFRFMFSILGKLSSWWSWRARILRYFGMAWLGSRFRN
jgi:hypothetical protein